MHLPFAYTTAHCVQSDKEEQMENFYEEDTERYFSVPRTEISNLKSRKAEFTCSVCGKKTRFAKKECHFFYSCDGYDYIDSVTCWRCELANNV